MINAYTLRKWSALLLVGFGSTITFFVVLKYYGFMWSIFGMLGALLVFALLGSLLLSTPFSKMLEGKGILVLNMDSTGIIRFSVVHLQQPYVVGKMNSKPITDIWDRNTVWQIEAPRKVGTAEQTKEGGLKIDIDESKLNKARFMFQQYPVVIWNNQIKSLLTKDWFAGEERATFAEHGILYMNRKMEELTSAMRDFGRYVVETTRPKGSLFGNKWVWIIIGIFLVIIAVMFAPSIIQAIQGGASGATGAVQQATSVVVPR